MTVMSSEDLPVGQVLGAGDDDHRRADMVIKADSIYTMAETREADARRFKAMAIRQGRIVALAPERDGADALIGVGTVVVSDPGLTVLPACDDTHTHLIGAGAEVDVTSRSAPSWRTPRNRASPSRMADPGRSTSVRTAV